VEESLSVHVGNNDTSSALQPSHWEMSAVAAECVIMDPESPARVEIYAAPIKSIERMREKVTEGHGIMRKDGGKLLH
jgi:hypothetical protein